MTQGTSCLATLGFETESRWDSPRGALPAHRQGNLAILSPATVKQSPLRQQILDFHRQLSDANACRVMDRRRDGGGNAGQADLADPARAQFVNLFVRIIQEMHFDQRRISVNGHQVVGQVAVDGCAALRIVVCARREPCRFPSPLHLRSDCDPQGD